MTIIKTKTAPSCTLAKGLSVALLVVASLLFGTPLRGSDIKPAVAIPEGKVLILNSYHQGYQWSDIELASIVETLDHNKFDSAPAIEYLDYRRHPAGEHAAELKALFRKKYQAKHFSLIVAMEYPALDFARKNQADLFHGAPIVFCGIYNAGTVRLAGNERITGVVSPLDRVGTIETMLKLHPQTREILVLHDYTPSGLSNRNDFQTVLPRFEKKVRFRFSQNKPMEETLKELGQLPRDTLVVLLIFASDVTGRTFAVPELTRLISRHSRVPVYGHTEVRLGHGIVGGKLLSPVAVAGEAASLMGRILRGEDVRTIPVVTKSASRYMFDYRQMERFQIPLSALPPDSVVINQPPPFYAANRTLVLTASGIIGFLSLVIGLLFFNIVQRKKAAAALRNSEARYCDLYENAPDMYYSVDAKTAAIVACNETFLRTTGYAKEDIIGQPIFDLFHPDCREEAIRSFKSFPDTGDVRDAERRVICKDGHLIDVSLNVSAVKDEGGKIINSRSIWRDITAHKLLEKELKNLSITDPMTGLYNRRGFITLAEQQLRQADRKKTGVMLMFADVDYLKQVNDTLGHQAGDETLVKAAVVLREVFRKMDIIARVGGDEFAVLAPETSLAYAEMIKNRLQDQLAVHNARGKGDFPLSLSIGVVYYDPSQPTSLDELMARADSLMYQQKAEKRL